MGFVEVAVNSGLPHRQTFSYAVPEGMTPAAGDAVLVPFGRRVLQGIVMEAVEVPAFPDPKPVEARVGERPVVSAERIELARWLAEYYLAPLFSAVALLLPPGFERRPLTFYEPLVATDELDAQPLPPRQRAVLAYLVEGGRREAKEIERSIAPRPSTGSGRTGAGGVATALSQLAQRGLVQRSYALARPTVRAKTIRYVEITASPAQAEEAIGALGARRKGRAAAALRLLLDAGGALPASELRLRAGAGRDVLAPLAEAGLIELRQAPVERDPLAG